MYKDTTVKIFDNFEDVLMRAKNLTEVAVHYGMPCSGRSYNKLRKEIASRGLSSTHLKVRKNLLNDITDEDFTTLLLTCGSVSEFCNKANINYTCYNTRVKERAARLGVNFEEDLRPDRWGKDELKIIRNYYQSMRPKDLAKLLPNRSVDAIKLKARALGLNSPLSSEFLSSVDILLDDTPESYYWMGFILADGHISEDNRLVVTLHKKDRNHLRKLANYIQAEHKERAGNSETKVSLAVKNQKILPLIKEKFDINNCKTYNPPSALFYENADARLLACLLCGFIDGDGHIKKQTNRQDVVIDIKIHGSWLDWLNVLHQRLHNQFLELPIASPKLNKRGYAYWAIANRVVVNYLKQITADNNLPVLERKWSRIESSTLIA